jgi:hypothetical protein
MNAGIYSLEQAQRFSDADLASVNNIDPKTARKIKE